MLRKMKINKYFLGIVLIIIIIMYFMAGVLFLGNTREDNNMLNCNPRFHTSYLG